MEAKLILNNSHVLVLSSQFLMVPCPSCSAFGRLSLVSPKRLSSHYDGLLYLVYLSRSHSSSCCMIPPWATQKDIRIVNDQQFIMCICVYKAWLLRYDR